MRRIRDFVMHRAGTKINPFALTVLCTMSLRQIFVTTALPYANGNFHIGHIMEYIQADIWVRFQRMQGHAVNFVGADDTHGEPRANASTVCRQHCRRPQTVFRWLSHQL